MGQALHISSGLVSQIGSNTLNFNTADRATSGTFTLGDANTTTMTIGGHANTATVNLGVNVPASGNINIGTAIGAGGLINIGKTGELVIVKGNLQVDGTEHVIGGTTFDSDVTLGDATADSVLVKGTLTFDGGTPGYVGGNIPFSANGGSTRAITIATAATSTGLTLSAGAASGPLNAGSDVLLVPGAAGAGGTLGSIAYGPSNVSDDTAYQILARSNAGASSTWAGIRYAKVTGRWEYQNDAGAWAPFVGTGGLLPACVTNQVLQGSGVNTWAAVNDLTLPTGGSREVKMVSGDSQLGLTVHAQDASSAATAGGATTIRGGAGLTSGAGGALVLAGGATGAGGTGGSASVRGGAGAAANGNVLVGDSNTVSVVLGAGANTWTLTTSTGLLGFAGTANIDLPNNASARFKVEGTGVGATVTAGNLDDLTDGSNADALHYHTTGTAAYVSFTSPVSGENLAAGEPLGTENNGGVSTVYKADANAAGTRHFCVGLAAAAATSPATTSIVTCGERTIADALWNTKPVAADTGKLVYLSETAGKLTYNSADLSAGSYLQMVGFITFADANANTTRVSVSIGTPVLL